MLSKREGMFVAVLPHKILRVEVLFFYKLSPSDRKLISYIFSQLSVFSFYELNKYDFSNISFIFIRFVTAQNFGNVHEIKFFFFPN